MDLYWNCFRNICYTCLAVLFLEMGSYCLYHIPSQDAHVAITNNRGTCGGPGPGARLRPGQAMFPVDSSQPRGPPSHSCGRPGPSSRLRPGRATFPVDSSQAGGSPSHSCGRLGPGARLRPGQAMYPVDSSQPGGSPSHSPTFKGIRKPCQGRES